MLIPYKDRVMSLGGNYFNYNEISHQEYSQHTAKHAATKKLDPDFFKPGSHAPILPLKGAANCSQKADFYTTTPYNAAEVYAHAQYWRLCTRTPDSWEKGGSSWLSGMMFCGQLVTSKLTKAQCIIVSNANNIANLGLKVTSKKIQGQDCYQFGSSIFALLCPYSWFFCTGSERVHEQTHQVGGAQLATFLQSYHFCCSGG